MPPVVVELEFTAVDAIRGENFIFVRRVRFLLEVRTEPTVVGDVVRWVHNSPRNVVDL